MNKEVEILRSEIEKIKDRNKRVEADKAWETSLLRRIMIASLTYITIVIFLFVINASRPFINAIVPVVGFLLSTLTITFIKKIWINYFLK